jgi:hypothetical protein
MEIQDELLEVKICRRCVYLIEKGKEISLTISKNGSNLCSCCGKKYATPYSIKVKILSVSEETDKLIQAKTRVIEMPTNWIGQGTQVFPRPKNSS